MDANRSAFDLFPHFDQHLYGLAVAYDEIACGAMAVVAGRFMPIIRTFVPFVAGIAAMPYRRFLAANASGGVLWVGVCVTGGYLWGNLPIVKQNFGLAIAGVILVSLAPGGVQRAWSCWHPRLDPRS